MRVNSPKGSLVRVLAKEMASSQHNGTFISEEWASVKFGSVARQFAASIAYLRTPLPLPHASLALYQYRRHRAKEGDHLRQVPYWGI